MRTVRSFVLGLLLLIVVLGVSTSASASRCTQYPYFMQPILCRF